mmetsp:Transcript_8533/g.28078  ORF Transcript_8533/g.28078 Transcript_8533/m.28078 type:complete len:238 (+) Transcript_8533:144-857(+)
MNNVPGRTDVRIRIGAACGSLGRWRRCAPPQPGWKERIQQPDGAHARRELADAHQLESGERRPHIPKAECAPRDGVQRREENEHVGGVRAREEAELAAAEQEALKAHGRRVDRESDAKQRGHRRHRRRHRRVLSEDAGAAEHDPNLGRAKTASGQMAEGGVQQPSAVPPTAASDTAPPSSMLTSNSLRLSSTAPFSGAPPGRILAAAGKHAGKYACAVCEIASPNLQPRKKTVATTW